MEKDKKQKYEEQKQYQAYVKEVTPKVNGVVSFIKAFVGGGIICILGQAVYEWCIYIRIPHNLANSYTTLALIALSILLTGLNLAGPIVKVIGAGYLVPITGFANAMASCALEYKKEGAVFGLGSQIFNIAGPVILYGVVTSFGLGLIYWICTFLTF